MGRNNNWINISCSMPAMWEYNSGPLLGQFTNKLPHIDRRLFHHKSKIVLDK
jgi:hypothetical protein